MKTTLNFLSLAIAGGFGAAEVAEAAGAHLPEAVNVQNAVIAFVVVLLALIALNDYAPKARPLAIAARAQPVAASCRPRATAGRRRGYAIRRGAEAARLPNPAPACPFRTGPALHYERAA